MRRNVFTTYDPQLPMGKKFVAVHVQNEDPLYFLVEVKAKVCELFVQISKFLNLIEPELFGLAIKSSDTFIFLDPLEKLSKYAPKPWKTQNNGMDNDGSPLFNVFFRVQFYVDSYLFISDKVAKYYYYHQLRENVLRYDQSMCEERSFLLASFALQADYGNYNPKLHKTRYFDPSHYFPSWVIEELGHDYIQRHLPSLHCDHKGMSKSEAQSMFIREASDPTAAHNFHLYKMVSNGKKSGTIGGGHSTDTWLAITITGLMIYAAESSTSSSSNVSINHPRRRLKTRISFFPWSDIGKLSFDKKKFEIRSIGPQSRKFIYYTGSEELARFLLWFSRASHQFHLMVLPKMKEMLKREQEINRRKYRETCITTVSNSSRTTSSSGNSSATGTGSEMMMICSGSENGNGSIIANSSNNTSKSVSPFEFINSSTNGKHHHHLHGTSDLDISTTSSVCDHHHLHLDDQQQRVSVISNASSNTTSGIASDRQMHGEDCLLMLGEDDSDQCPDVDDLDGSSDLLMSLNHHHHRHQNRAITLSGCSPQPQPMVVSMESLALSEPIIIQDHNNNRNHRSHQSSNHKQTNPATRMMAPGLKKHSISISNIMITAANNQNEPNSSSSQQIKATIIKTQEPREVSVPEATEVKVNGETNTPIKLCLNINDSKSSNDVLDDQQRENNAASSDDDDDDSYDDDHDSIFDPNQRNGCHGSGKSNVTVLSTILKPEAERLLKQGIDVVDGDATHPDLLIDDGIDSLELAELKEFEQQEKEKIILNSLIDNIPPPPLINNDDDSDSDSSTSDSSDSDDDDKEDNGQKQKTTTTGGNGKPNHYSPLAQERRLHQKNSYHQNTKKPPQHNNTTTKAQNSSPRKPTTTTIGSRIRSSSASVQNEQNPNKISSNPIYANVPVTASSMATKYQHTGFPPTVPLRPYPSLNSVPLGGIGSAPHYPHRTGMRIGVSSLSRPISTQKQLHSLLQSGCVHSNQNIPLTYGQTCLLNGSPSNLLSSAAGSEPNLYFGGGNACMTNNHMPTNKSDSVYDCRRIGGCGDITEATETSTVESSTPKLTNGAGHQQNSKSLATSTTFRQFIKNQLGSSPTTTTNLIRHQEKPLTIDISNMASGKQHIVPNTMITPPPSADYQIKNKLASLEQLSLSSGSSVNGGCNSSSSSPKVSPTSQQSISINYSPTNNKMAPLKKSKESRLKELRQRTSDLNLPLITALFNDSSLTLSDRFLDNDQPPKSQSMQHLTPPTASTNNGTMANCNQHHHKSGSSLYSSSGCCSTSSSTSSTPSRASPATVERSCTFRVDEAIAKSAMRHHNSKMMINHDANNNNQEQQTNTAAMVMARPISWHMDKANPLLSNYQPASTIVVAQPQKLRSSTGQPNYHHVPQLYGHRTTTLIHQ